MRVTAFVFLAVLAVVSARHHRGARTRRELKLDPFVQGIVDYLSEQFNGDELDTFYAGLSEQSDTVKALISEKLDENKGTLARTLDEIYVDNIDDVQNNEAFRTLRTKYTNMNANMLSAFDTYKGKTVEEIIAEVQATVGKALKTSGYKIPGKEDVTDAKELAIHRFNDMVIAVRAFGSAAYKQLDEYLKTSVR